MKAGWYFCFSTYNALTMDLDPEWPAAWTETEIGQIGHDPYDIRRLDSGAAPADHPHQVMGTIAFVNDVLSDGHYHYIQFYGNQWHQVTMGAVSHNHPYQVGGIGNIRFLPDYFCLFAYSENDALFDALAADSKWFLIGESIVTLDTENNKWLFGDIDNTAFTPTEIVQWTTRFQVALGREMPTVITNPRRLVSWFCPQAAPNMYDWWDEKKFRPISVDAPAGASMMTMTAIREDGTLVDIEPLLIAPPIIIIGHYSISLTSQWLWTKWIHLKGNIVALWNRIRKNK